MEAWKLFSVIFYWRSSFVQVLNDFYLNGVVTCLQKGSGTNVSKAHRFVFFLPHQKLASRLFMGDSEKAQQRCCTAINFANYCFQLNSGEALLPWLFGGAPLPAVSLACVCLAEQSQLRSNQKAQVNQWIGDASVRVTVLVLLWLLLFWPGRRDSQAGDSLTLLLAPKGICLHRVTVSKQKLWLV